MVSAKAELLGVETVTSIKKINKSLVHQFLVYFIDVG